MSYKVGMVSLGCPKNQVDAEIMLSLLSEGGYELTADEKQADAIIVNTCGFIGDAKKEAIENILELAQLKQTDNLKALIVTGCLAERYRDEILSEMPEVDAVVGIGSNKNICSVVKAAVEGCPYSEFGEKTALLMDHDRILTTPPYSAYLRVADGCDNCCTYCAIPMIRGGYRSRKMEDILAEANTLAQNGAKEIILIAQDTTRYGEDIYNKLMLPQLLDKLCEIDGIKWIRILYTYPDKITDELLHTIKNQPKVLNYLDIPLQHASGDVLSRMNRTGDFDSLTKLIAHIREIIPGITIRTTFIVGFPGETEEDFEQLATFVKNTGFNRMGCFTYSPEEGTVAADMEDQVDEDVKQRRQEILMTEQSVVNEEISADMIGKNVTVLIEGYDSLNKCYYGRSEADAPDIDGKVFIASTKPLSVGDMVEVCVFDVIDYDLLGDLVD